MASAVDPTVPVQGSPTTASVRSNFSIIKSELETLQATAGVGPQGPIGPTGPSGTLTVGTVTTGAAGTNAAVTNTGTTQAAVLNFTLPRGDAGTGGSGITETQAKDAVRQGNVQFLEVPATEAATWATTPILQQPPVVGANWTPATGGTATQAYTHDTGNTATLAYPASISNGNFYQIVFGMSNVPATSTATYSFFSLYFRTAPTVTTGQQAVALNVTAGNTIVIQATANFTHFVVVPVSGWQGTFTLTRIVVGGTQNSGSLSIKDWAIRVRGNTQFDGGGGRFSTSASGTAFGFKALNALTTGTNNVAVGENALSSATTAGSNTAIGQNALRDNATGFGNAAVGDTALIVNQTGGYNASFGQNTLRECQTGSYNVAVGTSALGGTRTGIGNVGIGYVAMGQNQWGGDFTSSYNIAIGYLAAWTPLVGTDNIAIGQYALAGQQGPPGPITTSNVIAIGSNAGRIYGTAGTDYTSSILNSVLVGHHARPAGNSQTNQIVIGYEATGHGSNTITLGNSDITAIHCQVQTISALSDSRVKENIQAADLNKCLTAVKNLLVSEWDWLPIAGPHANKHDIGFVSDDVKKVFPTAVSTEDRSLTMRDADGKPEMTTVTETVGTWTPDEQPSDRRTVTRQIEKTTEIKGLQYVSTSEMLPTLWGAVQQLIQRIEQLEKPADNPGGASDNPGSSESKQGFFRGKKHQ